MVPNVTLNNCLCLVFDLIMRKWESWLINKRSCNLRRTSPHPSISFSQEQTALRPTDFHFHHLVSAGFHSINGKHLPPPQRKPSLHKYHIWPYSWTWRNTTLIWKEANSFETNYLLAVIKVHHDVSHGEHLKSWVVSVPTHHGPAATVYCN